MWIGNVRGIFLLILVSLTSASAQTANQQESVRKAYQAGEKAMQQGDLETAERCFFKVLELVPNDVGARVNLGVECMRRRKWKQALQYLNDAERLAPQVAGIRFNIGLVHYRQGEYAAAIPEFAAVVKEQADATQARRLLGLCYLFEERYAESAAELEPLWPASSGDVSYLYSLAVAAGNSGQHELEERAVKQLTATGAGSPLLHLLLGKAYMAHEDYVHALPELQQAVAGNAKLPMLHYNLGVLYRRQGALDKARAEFLEDAALEPDLAYNYDQLGALASLNDKEHEAEAYFRNAVRRDRKLGTSWWGLAKIYRQQKRYAESLSALNEAGQLDPQSASVHYLRAQVLTSLGRGNDARAEFEMVQRLKRETVDKLEQQVSGSKYVDPDLQKQAQ